MVNKKIDISENLFRGSACGTGEKPRDWGAPRAGAGTRCRPAWGSRSRSGRCSVESTSRERSSRVCNRVGSRTHGSDSGLKKCNKRSWWFASWEMLAQAQVARRRPPLRLRRGPGRARPPTAFRQCISTLRRDASGRSFRAPRGRSFAPSRPPPFEAQVTERALVVMA